MADTIQVTTLPQRDSRSRRTTVCVSREQIRRAAEILADSNANLYLPVWKEEDDPRWQGDGRIRPMAHVERVIRALNGV